MAISRIYLKLAAYYALMIAICCFATAALFFMTLGYPMAKDTHRLIRNQALFLADMTAEHIVRGPEGGAGLERFLAASSGSYEAELSVFDRDLKPVAASHDGPSHRRALTPAMLSAIHEKGVYVRASHIGKPLIYVLPLKTAEVGPHYLMIYKPFDTLRQAAVLFGAGLVVLCVLLILGIYPLARGFIRPMTQLTTALKAVSAGNFAVTLDVEKRNDELGELLEVFLEMAASVDRMIASRKELLADISHELRSPLARLSVAAELVRETAPTPEVQGYAESIEYEIGFMDNLLRQLAEYSALNLPAMCLNQEYIPAMDILEEAYQRHAALMEKSGLRFVPAPGDRNLVVHADKARIMQVMANLLDNAAQACGPGGEITLGLSPSGGQVEFWVANTGPEIPAELREKIFEPLFRTDPSRSRKTGGLGLGLAICRKIVELHGGTIVCTCADGITRFTFQLKGVS